MQLKEKILFGLEGLKTHKLRSILTMLGIIFGVGAVIAMLSIGEGAKREALEKYKFLGVNNIIIRDRDLSDKELEEMRAKFSRGLSLKDANAIEKIVPTIDKVAPQAELQVEAKFEDRSTKVTLVGITLDFKSILNYETKAGQFLKAQHHDQEARVCVIGAEVANSLFRATNPLNNYIKLDDQWFLVVGVMDNKMLFTETVGELAARDLNQDIYIPLTTMLSRFDKERELDSELDQITVKVQESENLISSAAVIRKLLDRRHRDNNDFSIIIPFELLKQEEKERRIYNVVLGSIAAISLLVGGIGIMNIMLATVLERTREIGIRRALGARQNEILTQFLIEAVGLSLSGGIIGIILGITMSLSINSIAEFETAITPISVIVAFGVSGAVGIIFGTFPARRAANVNPIDALRYE